MIWQYCVVGNGLLGAAVALELSKRADDVFLVGAKYGDENSFFSGHEDESRMVRRFHGDAYWEGLTERNMLKLHELIQATGMDVFRSMPVLYRFRPEAVPHSPLVKLRDIKDDDGIAEYFSHEDVGGGVINPKSYVAALNMAATANGAVVRSAVVQRITRGQGSFEVSTRDMAIRSRRVVDARGCHQPNLQSEDSGVVGKIAIFAEVDAPQHPQPFAFIDAADEHSSFRDVYGFHQYHVAGGRAISKFGFSERDPVRLAPDKISDWFRSGYRSHPALGEASAWVGDFLDRGQISIVKPCAFVVTSSGRPHIHCEEGLLSIIGCNGMVAKCCQALAEDTVALLRTSESQ